MSKSGHGLDLHCANHCVVHHILEEVDLSGVKEKKGKKVTTKDDLQIPLPHVVTRPEASNDDGWVGGAHKGKNPTFVRRSCI